MPSSTVAIDEHEGGPGESDNDQIFATREEYLTALQAELADFMERLCGYRPPHASISVGWPAGKAREGAGLYEVVNPDRVSHGVPAIFLSPRIKDSYSALAWLYVALSELVPSKVRDNLGFVRKGPETVDLDQPMQDLLAGIIEAAGRFEDMHDYISVAARPAAKKQTTRMKKFQCSQCGIVLRATQTHADKILEVFRAGCEAVCPQMPNMGGSGGQPQQSNADFELHPPPPPQPGQSEAGEGQQDSQSGEPNESTTQDDQGNDSESSGPQNASSDTGQSTTPEEGTEPSSSNTATAQQEASQSPQESSSQPEASEQQTSSSPEPQWSQSEAETHSSSSSEEERTPEPTPTEQPSTPTPAEESRSDDGEDGTTATGPQNGEEEASEETETVETEAEDAGEDAGEEDALAAIAQYEAGDETGETVGTGTEGESNDEDEGGGGDQASAIHAIASAPPRFFKVDESNRVYMEGCVVCGERCGSRDCENRCSHEFICRRCQLSGYYWDGTTPLEGVRA